MFCPRIDHFVRFNDNGTLSKCGHMVSPPTFASWDEMQSSAWLQNLKEQLDKDVWPPECLRCNDTETKTNQSVRLTTTLRHNLLKYFDKDYIILGGVLDNVCNSACQSCNSQLSTKIGSLKSKTYPIVDNSALFDCVPLDRVVEIDLNGGEPTASPRYKQLLENLPPNVKLIRVNTNMSKVLPNIEGILEQGIKVIITASIDGTGMVHDYVRWPIKWTNYQHTVDQYLNLRVKYKNLELQGWTVLHSLNVIDFENILNFCNQHNIGHAWSLLDYPDDLNPKYKNSLTEHAQKVMSGSTNQQVVAVSSMIAVGDNNQSRLDKFINDQDQLRSINIKDYL